MSDIKKSSTIDSKQNFDDFIPPNIDKPFQAFPRSSNGFFPMYGKTKKGSFTDTSKYIPLYVSIMNMQQGKSVSGASSVNLVSSRDYDFPDGKVPEGWKPSDGLLSMDIADISQMQRELSDRISKVEKSLKNADDQKTLLAIRESIKAREKVSDSLISALSDKALSGILTKYNSTIQ